MPNVIAITDKIDHMKCLSGQGGWAGVDTMTIGDPENYVMSPCCVHGYRVIWSPRPMLNWFRPSVAKTASITGRSSDSNDWQGGYTTYTDSKGQQNANIDTIGLGTFHYLDTSGRDSWHSVGMSKQSIWDWSNSTDISKFNSGELSFGGDRPAWFTPGAIIKGKGGGGTSWVLVDGFSGGTSKGDPPANIQAKWWGTTQSDLATSAEEQGIQADYKPGQTVTIFKTGPDGPNENSGVGLSTQLGPTVGGANSLWINYGQRIRIGVVKCTDASPHVHSSGAPNWGGVGAPDLEVFKDIVAGPSHEGGYTPEIVIYGGDVRGAKARANILPNGDIESFTMTDPGATVIDMDFVDSPGARHGDLPNEKEIKEPQVALTTPSRIYEGFEVNVDVSSILTELETVYPNWFMTSQEMHSALSDGYLDPIAQTFRINRDTYNNGIFLHSVDVCFSNKPMWGNHESVTLEIRPTVNGYPSSDVILVDKTLVCDEVVVADGSGGSHLREWDSPNNPTVTGEILPNFNDNNATKAYTRFELPYPVYLESGKEYCFVIRSNNSDYRVWVSDAQLPSITSGMVDNYDNEGYENITNGSGRPQYGGSYFRSQNGRTWEPNQQWDIMFRLNKCLFKNPDVEKTVTLRAGQGIQTYDFDYDRLDFVADSIVLPNQETTTVSGMLTTYDEVGNPTVIDVGNMQEDGTRDLDKRMRLLKEKGLSSASMKLDITMKTTDPHVSPQVCTKNITAHPLQNKIDNAGLAVKDLIFINTGSYTVGDKIEVGPVGLGPGTSNAVFVVGGEDPDGGIDPAYLTVESPGSGFYRKGAGATVITKSGGGSGAEIVINSEEGRDGGNAKARYVSQSVTLAPGIEARHLRVFMTAHKPEGSNIYLYYKILSGEDTQEMSDKRWTLMTQSTPDGDLFHNTSSWRDGKEVSEFEFNSSEIITYAEEIDTSIAIPPTYDTFKSFKLKFVLTASNPARSPIIKNLRAIAVY